VVHRTKSDSEGIQNPLQGLCGSQNDAKNAAETVASNLEGIWSVQEGRKDKGIEQNLLRSELIN